MSDTQRFEPTMNGKSSETDSAVPSDLEMFEKYLEEGPDLDIPVRGDLRKGVIVEVRPNEILVNVGSKRDGVVPQADLTRLEPEFLKSLHEGQTIDVVVGRQPEDDGIFVLSISEAQQQKDWILAQELLDSTDITAHRVIGYNKGGLTVEFGQLRGFVPASHIVDMPRNLSEDQRREQFEQRINQEMNLVVIEVERRRRRLVMSEMLAERRLRDSAKEHLFDTLKVGDVLEGEVRSIRPFGAFVDIGGADGLLHVSEIEWTPIGHPRDALQVGDKVKVQIIRLDPENHRIALSRKRVLPNPWDGIESRYHAGDIVPVKVTRVVDFGAFAQLEPGVEGLIHVSELAEIAVAEPLKALRPGDKIDVKILRIDSARQRVGLSRRQAILEQGASTQSDWVVGEPDAQDDTPDAEESTDA